MMEAVLAQWLESQSGWSGFRKEQGGIGDSTDNAFKLLERGARKWDGGFQGKWGQERILLLSLFSFVC